MKRTITLDTFNPRWYQIPIINALEKDNFKKAILVWSRRAGKDVTCWNLLIRQALFKVGNYYYIFPSYAQGKKALWNSITIDGKRFLNFIPEDLIVSTNSQEMFIRIKNGSTIQILGAANYDSLMGTNPRGIVFSEFAKTDPMALQYLLPVLNANDGFVVINSTPRGKNDFYKLYQIAKEYPNEWYSELKTVDDLQHFPVERIEQDITSGLTSYDLARQEYWCDFSLGVSGAYYAHYYDIMEREERITHVQWEPDFPVHTSWDLGMRDSTSIIFFQTIGRAIHIIDSYKNSDQGLEHYIKLVKEKPYIYGKHIAPHDIKVRELGTGMSRLEKARQLGIGFTLSANLSIDDGIEAVRTILPRVWIDESKCEDVIKAIENYRKEYDEKRKLYKSRPLHDAHSHMADALRYLAVSLPKTQDSYSSDDLQKAYDEVHWGGSNSLPRPFR